MDQCRGQRAISECLVKRRKFLHFSLSFIKDCYLFYAWFLKISTAWLTWSDTEIELRSHFPILIYNNFCNSPSNIYSFSKLIYYTVFMQVSSFIFIPITLRTVNCNLFLLNRKILYRFTKHSFHIYSQNYWNNFSISKVTSTHPESCFHTTSIQ